MKNISKKIIILLCFSLILTGLLTPVSFNYAADPNTIYTPLAPLPGMTEPIDVSKTSSFGTYLNVVINLVIGISAVLAVVMTVIGGIEYMTSELPGGKEGGKDRIKDALLGLLIALGAYALLNTINSDLLNSNINISAVTVTVDLGGESTAPFVPISPASLQTLGINCPGSGGKGSVDSIGQQFIGKSTYSQTLRNTVTSSTAYVDCSSFVAQVYACAGLANPGDNTSAMFSSGARAVVGATFDFTTLNPGDMIGWKPSDDASGNGHVMIYLGNGKVLHASSTAGGVTISDLNSYKNRVTYVKWS